MRSEKRNVSDMVSNSQAHYGSDVPLFVEDQPGCRGSAPTNTDTRELAQEIRGEGMHQSMIEAGSTVAGESRRWHHGEQEFRAASELAWRGAA